MKSPTHPFNRPTSLAAATLALATTSVLAQTTLLTDNFDEDPVNEIAEAFNDNLAATQGGSLAPTAYNIDSGNSNAAQHGNGGTQMTLATFPNPDGRGFGRVSLSNDFATQANAADQPLQVSFTIATVFGYVGAEDRWVSFSIGNTPNQFITGHSIGVLFRANGATQTLAAETQLGGTPDWTANDLVTITLSGSGGVGSAFITNGSEATITIGANNIGTFALPQQTNAYLTFSAFNDVSDVTGVFGGGNFDDLNISLAAATADPFSDWMTTNFPEIEAPENAPTADPDKDGIANLVEYVVQGGDPSVSTTGILPTLDASGENFVFTYLRRTAATGVTQTFQYGNDLSGWTDVPIIEGGMISITSPEAGIEQVVITVDKGAEIELFGRLQVTRP